MDSKLKGLIDVVTKEKEHNKNAINAMNNLILENQNKDSNYKLLYSMYDTLSKQNSQIQQQLNSLTSGTKPAPAMVNASVIPTNPNQDIVALRKTAVDIMMSRIFGDNV